jgi:hypothetical protein
MPGREPEGETMAVAAGVRAQAQQPQTQKAEAAKPAPPSSPTPSSSASPSKGPTGSAAQASEGAATVGSAPTQQRPRLEKIDAIQPELRDEYLAKQQKLKNSAKQTEQPVGDKLDAKRTKPFNWEKVRQDLQKKLDSGKDLSQAELQQLNEAREKSNYLDKQQEKARQDKPRKGSDTVVEGPKDGLRPNLSPKEARERIHSTPSPAFLESHPDFAQQWLNAQLEIKDYAQEQQSSTDLLDGLGALGGAIGDVIDGATGGALDWLTSTIGSLLDGNTKDDE